jgi:hypothetical protein
MAFRCILAAGLLLLGGMPALSADRWEAAGSGAVAILPMPKPAKGITGGSLYCAEQRWAFLFRLSPDSGLAPGTIEKARLAAADLKLELDADIAAEAATIGVPREMIAAVKSGTVLKVEIGAGKTAPKATFNLRYSKAVIEAVAPLCSQIDMSAYQRVTLSETDPAVPVATGLLEDDIRLFRDYTSAQPSVATVTLDLGGGKRLLFASLCGSNGYFGETGCSTTGYAAEGADGAWRMVYETDGVLLHTDPGKAVDGWPDLVTLPIVGGTEATHWTWSGDRYEAVGPTLSEDDTGAGEQGDTAQ